MTDNEKIMEWVKRKKDGKDWWELLAKDEQLEVLRVYGGLFKGKEDDRTTTAA